MDTGPIPAPTDPSPAAEVTERLAQLERALAAANEGLIEVIYGEKVLYLSPRVYEMLGLPPDGAPLSRRALADLVHPDDLPAYIAQREAAAQGRLRFTTTFRLRHASGQWRWFRQHCRFEALPDGRLRATAMLADVHEARAAQDELQAHRELLEALVAERTRSLEEALALAEARRHEAERAVAVRTQFLAHMSHEIRTPLNGVMGLVELSRRAAESPQQQRWLELAEQSGLTLQRLINDVLDYSRLEAGRLELSPQPTDLPQMMALTMRGLTALARRGDLSLLYDWDGSPHRLMVDEPRLTQILINLLGNALKFTERGHIALTGQARAREDGLVDLTLRIEDTGPGVPAAHREAVFEAFVQGQSPRGEGGTGLGLAIARTLARTMGGELTLDDRPGGGAVFTLCLTLAPAPAEAADTTTPARPQPTPAPAPERSSLGDCWLLHTERAAAPWVQGRLMRAGWQARVMGSADEALRALRDGAPRPSLVIIAAPLLVPGIDLEGLRAALPQAHIALLVRADWNDVDLERRAQALDMRCWAAPFSPSDLDALAAGSRTPAPMAGVVPLAAPAGRSVLLVEDNPVNQLIGLEFLRTLGLEARCAADGEAAIEACLVEPPALVLMDVHMPVLDGLQATRRLRALQAEQRLPHFAVAGLTAYASAADRAACMAAGMDDCLTKPLAMAQLRQALQRWLPTA